VSQGPPSPQGACFQAGETPSCSGRSIESRLSKVEGGVQGHAKASQRLASVQAMRRATERRAPAPPRALTRAKVGAMARREEQVRAQRDLAAADALCPCGVMHLSPVGLRGAR
jgi:hypothetical protein